MVMRGRRLGHVLRVILPHTNIDDDRQVQVHTIVGTIQIGSLHVLFGISGRIISKCTLDGSHMCKGSSKVVMRAHMTHWDGRHMCKGSSN
jgi:hypothetical protein